MTDETRQQIKQPTDAERLQWVLRYGMARTLGTGADDYDYHPITLEMIDKAIAKE